MREGQAREKQIWGPNPRMRQSTASTRQQSKGQGVGQPVSKGAEGGPHALEGKMCGRVGSSEKKSQEVFFWKPTRQNDSTEGTKWEKMPMPEARVSLKVKCEHAQQQSPRTGLVDSSQDRRG